jgi:alpha-mannosidase
MTTTVHVISHTHWDREWYLTYEQYRSRLVDLVDAVLDRMNADPRFEYFHLDGQAIVLEDYLEIRPEREEEIRRRVREVRLLVGPWYVMPDMFLVSGESLVRNLALGMRTAQAFGRCMDVGYIPDPFGHVSQMPQILHGMRLHGAILWRGFGGRRAEYVWRAPDGTEVLLSHLPPDGYCNGVRLPLAGRDDMRGQASAVIDYERQRSLSGQVLLMVGVDHVEPHPKLQDVIDVIDGLPDTSARLSTLPAFVRAVREAVAGAELQTVDGELRGGQNYAHLLPGVLSARTYLKQANAAAQRELEQWAEPLAVFASLLGASPPSGLLRYAWRTLLQNHPHDSICGCSIDAVHDENMTRFAKVRETTDAAAHKAARAIADAVPPPPAGGLRAVVVNTAATAWQGVIEAEIDIPLGPAPGFPSVDFTTLDEPAPFFGDDAHVASVTDADGNAMTFQMLEYVDTVAFRMSRYTPPPGVRVRRTRLAIDVRDVPPMGYTTLDMHMSAQRAAQPAQAAAGSALEHDLLHVELRPDGSFDVVDKRTGTRYQRVFTIEDVGDVGDEYNYSPPRADERVTTAAATNLRTEILAEGPLVFAMAVSYDLSVPEAARTDRGGRASTRVALPCRLDVRLHAGSPVVDGGVSTTNAARDHRLRLLMPTGAAHVEVHRADSAFDVVTRPAAPVVPEGTLMETPVATAPMQSFVDAGDATTGAVVVADGLPEFEVVHEEEQAFVAVTLVRAVGDLSRNDLATRRGHAGPGLATPGAQCLGPHRFHVAFVPRREPPAPDALYGIARDVLAPPRVVAPAGGSGRAPASQSLLPLAAGPGPRPVLSACKLADDLDAIVLRFFNPAPTSGSMLVTLPENVSGAHETDLAERRVAPLQRSDGRVTVALPPHRILTVEIARE